MNKEYIDVAVVPYALADTLLALYNAGIKEIVITKEDNDIHIRIDKQKVEKSVYGIIDKISKELKRELFNIYDVVVFEDENGITQDCVCAITKWEKEIDKIVGVIECNNHSISIYENGSYKVWEKDGKNLPYYNTGKKIIHLYTLKNDGRFYEVYPINDYEDIDNVKSSEALEEIKTLRSFNQVELNNDKNVNKSLDIIEQALQRLKQIDNAKPSEALKALIQVKNFLGYNYCSVDLSNELKIIHHAILKAQEKEPDVIICKMTIINLNKVLNIIFNKGLPLAEIKMIKQSENYERYNIAYSWANWKNASIQKTKEEFILLKRYIDYDKNN